MGSMSRQKGKRGEREAAAELGALLGVTGRRGVQYQGSPDSPDIVLEGARIAVECKRVERLNLWAAVEQAREDAKPGHVPIVWHRPSRRDSVIVVETSRLLDLAREVVRIAGQGESGG